MVGLKSRYLCLCRFYPALLELDHGGIEIIITSQCEGQDLNLLELDHGGIEMTAEDKHGCICSLLLELDHGGIEILPAAGRKDPVKLVRIRPWWD